MRVLVTGGAGFIGSHTVDVLIDKGYQVRVLDSLEPPVHPASQKPDYLNKQAEFLLGNVCDAAVVEAALEGVDGVIHLAAHQGYLPDFSSFATTNDAGTALLFEIIVKRKLPVSKVVVASSQAVYGEGAYECEEHGVQYPPLRSVKQLDEKKWDNYCPDCGRVLKPIKTGESTVNPHNQYSVSKYAQELYSLVLGKRYGIPTTALRYSITQGPRHSFFNAYSGILRIFATQLLAGRSPLVYEDGRQLRDYVDVRDVARANVLTFEDTRADYQVFNVGGTAVLSVLEYGELVKSISGLEGSFKIPGVYRFGDTRHIISDIEKLSGLGWKPRVPIQQTIGDYFQWVKEQPAITDCSEEAERVMKKEGVIR